MKTEREKRNGVPQASCPVGMNVVLSCALGQVWWTDNHSCSNCDSFAYMSWMQGKLSRSCQSMNLLTETFGSSLIQNGLNFFFPSPLFPETVYCSPLFQFVLPGQGGLGGPWSGPRACLPGSRSYYAPVGDGCVIQCV